MLITISRLFASGSSEVAARVARELGWRLVDNELVDHVAERAGMAPEDVARLEERAPSFVERLARMAALELPEGFLPAPAVVEGFEEAKLVRITASVVAELAAEDRVVFVGRAAADVLAREPDALHVFLVATRSFRARRVAERLGLDLAQAERITDDADRNRARYHREYYDRDWRDPALYDMLLNSERLGFQGAADAVVDRCRRLGWSGG